MFVTTNERLARRRIVASEAMINVAQRNVLVSRQWPIVANATDQSFSEKIRQAAEKRRQANKQAQQQPSRVRKVQPRQRTKSD